MIISPDCEIKPLSECDAGKLVRLVNHWGDGEFALVADLENGEGRALILFQEGTPVYLIDNNPAQLKVLAYSSDLIFEVDQHGPYEHNIRELYETSGCVILEGTRWLLNVREPNPEFRPHRAQYDFETFQLVEVSREINNIAIFGRWSLYLGDRDTLREERVSIAAFEWKSPQSRES